MFTSEGVIDAIDENSGADQVIYTATTTDTTSVSYSLEFLNNDDHSSFVIDSKSGEVMLIDNPDYEAKSSYSFTVIATDAAGLTSEQLLTLFVNDLNDHPLDFSLSSFSFHENISINSVIADLIPSTADFLESSILHSL